MNRARNTGRVAATAVVLGVTGLILAVIGVGISFYAWEGIPRYPSEMYVSEYEHSVLTALIGIQKVAIMLTTGAFTAAAAACLFGSVVLAQIAGGRTNGCNLHGPCVLCDAPL